MIRAVTAVAMEKIDSIQVAISCTRRVTVTPPLVTSVFFITPPGALGIDKPD